jgi:hypothetical protein
VGHRDRRIAQCTVAICIAATLSGCSEVRVDEGGRSTAYKVEHHFGYVRVLRPKAEGNLTVEDLTSLGIRIGPGFGLGYFDEQRVIKPLPTTACEAGEATCSIDAEICDLVVIIHDKRDLAHAMDMVKALGDQRICGVTFQE